MMTLDFDNAREKLSEDESVIVEEGKKTILIYSPDLNFCFSLSMLFQDRYNVITTTNVGMLHSFVSHYSANLLIMDAAPSEKIIDHVHAIKDFNKRLPIIMLYVYSPKEASLDSRIRQEIDSVFYKPFDLAAVSKRIDELLPAI